MIVKWKGSPLAQYFYLVGQAVLTAFDISISVVSNKLNTQLLANVYFCYHLPDETVTIVMVYLVKNTLNVFSDKLGDFHLHYLIRNESPPPPPPLPSHLVKFTQMFTMGYRGTLNLKRLQVALNPLQCFKLNRSCILIFLVIMQK